jgi:hypothetical protein
VGPSPLPPEVARPIKNGFRQTPRRGSTSWALPRSPTDAPTASHKAAAAVLHSSAQADDYQLLMSDSSSILSGCETVAPQSRDGSCNRPGWKRPYGLLTGLLSRRGDHTSRKGKSGGPQQQQEQQQEEEQSTSPPHVSPTHTVRPGSRASPIPLLEGFAGVETNASGAGTQIGAGGYDWPVPPSPIQKLGSLQMPANSGSPMLSLPSHVSPISWEGRAERRDKRTGSRFTDHGESHFVPLSSTDISNRGGSASVRRPEVDDANVDEALDMSGASSKCGTSRRCRTHHNGTIAVTASLSTSESQSTGHLANTRGSQARMLGTDENELSAPSSSSNVRSLRDAKAALLRHAQGLNASVRSSRAQSFRRVPSNVGGGGGNGDGNNNTVLPTHRSAKARVVSRERRSLNGSRSGVGRDDGCSLYSIGFDDDAMRMSVSPGSMGSPMSGRPGMLFPATAANQDGNIASPSHAGTSRRFSHNDDGSVPILEVMETSALTSHGNVGGCSNHAGSSAQTTRGRSSGSIAKLNGGHSSNGAREEVSFAPSTSAHTQSPRTRRSRMISAGYSLSRTGGYGGSDDSNDSVEMEERHRQKVDEVFRRLNRPHRSTTGNNQSTMSRAATSVMDGIGGEVVRAPNASPGHSMVDPCNSGTSADNNDNSTSAGGGAIWSCIGGPRWGGLASFGAGAAAESTNDEGTGGTGGWTGLGGDGGSEDWYARMRKKAAEEEKAEAAAAAAATATISAATNTSGMEANIKLLSPGTVSITASPGQVPNSNPTSGGSVTQSTTATSEAPMPGVTRSPGNQHSSAISSVRNLGARLSLTPITVSSSTSANTSALPTRPLTLASSRSPLKPSKPSATTECGGVTHVSPLKERFERHSPGAADLTDQSQRNTPASKLGVSPLDPPMGETEGVEVRTPTPPGRTEASVTILTSGRQPTLPGTAAAHSFRNGSRNGTFLKSAAAATRVNVDGSGKPTSTTPTTAVPSTANRNSPTGVVLPALSPKRAESSTPLSNDSSRTTTPGHRRFDFRNRGSLPRVLPASSVNGATPTNGNGGRSSIYNTSPSTCAAHRGERVSLVPSIAASSGTFGEGAMQPVSPATSMSQHTQKMSTQASTGSAFMTVGASHSAGNGSSLGTRRHSSPNKRTTTMSATSPSAAATALRAGSAGLVHPTLPSGAAPKKPEGTAAVPRVIAASTRLSIS